MKKLFETRPPAEIEDLVRLASVLMAVDGSGKRFDPGQYQGLVKRLTATLEAASAGPVLEAVLMAFPAVATIYENVNYQHAGLCRSALAQNLDSERLAVAAIGRARMHERSEPGIQTL